MWHPYENKEHVNTILSTWNTSDYLVFLGKINSDKWPQGASYAYKPKKMHQINIQTGRKRGIRIVRKRLPRLTSALCTVAKQLRLNSQASTSHLTVSLSLCHQVPNAVLSDDSSTRLSTRASDCQRLTPISVRSVSCHPPRAYSPSCRI